MVWAADEGEEYPQSAELKQEGRYWTMRALLKHALPCLSVLLLSGCVSNSTLPSPNIGTILQASDADGSTKPAPSAETNAQQPAVASNTQVPVPKANPTQVQKPAATPVKTALAPDTTKLTPVQQAAGEVAKPKAAESSLTPASPATTTTPKPAEATKPKSANNLWALFQNNQAANVQNSSSAAKPKPAVKTTTTAAVKPKPKKPAPTVIVSNNAKRGKKGKGSLPGVNLKKLFGIDTQDVEERDEAVEVASITNRARRGTHGLLLQRPSVKVGCFPRKLVRLLKKVERRYGRTPIVTSGYRSRAYNRRIRGARNSMHIRCMAADIQVRGVSKWALAKYLRSLPGRGGVGTYCHTKSVHIDIAGKRDWNRRCRRSKRRKRRS